MKVMIYVDAENVIPEKLQATLKEVRQRHSATDIIGKFYGTQRNLGDVFQICLSHGLEFVDTSSITQHRKNAADIKLTADAMYDVLGPFAGEVSRVYLLSGDTDFLPLIYKLLSVGIPVDSFICTEENLSYTTKDVLAALYKVGFLPPSVQQSFDVVWFNVHQALDGSIPDDVILQFVEEKYSKFCDALQLIVDSNVLSELRSLSVREVSAKEVLVRVKGCAAAKQELVLRTYCQQMFGSAPRKALIRDFITKE